MRVAAIREVGVVRSVDHPGDEPPLDKDRLTEHDIGQVRTAARIGVIADEHVARPHRVDWVPPDDLGDDADQAAEMHRDVLGLAQHRAGPVEQSRRSLMLVE
jgi:hypothetical protein